MSDDINHGHLGAWVAGIAKHAPESLRDHADVVRHAGRRIASNEGAVVTSVRRLPDGCGFEVILVTDDPECWRW